MQQKPPEQRIAEEHGILQFFVFEHLPQPLQDISGPYGELARRTVLTIERNPERTVALRKLLEAKDAAVRAALYTSDAQ